MVKKLDDMLAVSTEYRPVTDGQTDRQTDGPTDGQTSFDNVVRA